MTFVTTMKALSGSIVRGMFSALPTGFYGDISFPQGISVNIVTRNDPWFLESLLSILNLSDEIIVVDSSEEPYLSYNHKVIEYLNDDRIKYISRELNILEARRLAKSLSTKEIIIRWDADMIAFDGGKDPLSARLNKFANISSNRKFIVLFPIVTFFGDLDHVLSPPFQSEAWIFSNTKKELYRPRYEDSKIGTVLEGFHPPVYFRKYIIDSPLAVHMSLIMPVEKIIQKHLQKLWMNNSYREKYGTFQEMRDEIGKNIKIENQYRTVKFSDSIQNPLPRLLSRFEGMTSKTIIEQRMGEIENLLVPDELVKLISTSQQKRI